MLDGEGAWKHNEKIDLVVNPDYDGGRKAQNGGLDIIFYATQERPTPTSRVATSMCSTPSPTARCRRTRTSSPTARSTRPRPTSSRSRSRPPAHFDGEEGDFRRAAISKAINREEITDVIFSGTRTPAHDFTSPVIAGYSEDIPGSEVLDFDADEAKELWAEADAIAPWDGTFQIAYNADGGHQAWVDAVANQLKNNLGIDASGAPYPTFAEAHRDHRPHHPDRVPHRLAGRLPGPVQLPRTDLRHGRRLERRRLLEPRGRPAPRRGPCRDRPRRRERQVPAGAGDPVRGPSRDPPLVRDGQRRLGRGVENVQYGWDTVPLYYEVTKSE